MQKIRAGSLFFIFLFLSKFIYNAKLEPQPKNLSPRSQLISDLDGAMQKFEIAFVSATLNALDARVTTKTVSVATEKERYALLLDLAFIKNALNKKKLDDACAKQFDALVIKIGAQYQDLGYTQEVIEKAAFGLESPKRNQAVREFNRMRFGGSISASTSPAQVSSTLGASSISKSGLLLAVSNSRRTVRASKQNFSLVKGLQLDSKEKKVKKDGKKGLSSTQQFSSVVRESSSSTPVSGSSSSPALK